MSEQKPEPLSADEVARARWAHCRWCIDDLHMDACKCECHRWTMRLIATIDAKDAEIAELHAGCPHAIELATARRTMDEMRERIETAVWSSNQLLESRRDVLAVLAKVEGVRDSLAEQLKAEHERVALSARRVVDLEREWNLLRQRAAKAEQAIEKLEADVRRKDAALRDLQRELPTRGHGPDPSYPGHCETCGIRLPCVWSIAAGIIDAALAPAEPETAD